MSHINIVLIIITFLIVLYNVSSGKKSGYLYLAAMIPVLVIAVIFFIHLDHGQRSIGSSFENIKTYEVKYLVDVKVPDKTVNDRKKLAANFSRPEAECSIFNKIFSWKNCKRDILLEDVITAETITDPPYGLNFQPSNCMISGFNEETSCVDDHGHTWIITLFDEKAE